MLVLAGGCGLPPKRLAELVTMGDERELREDEGIGAADRDRRPLLVLALDGVPRDLLYGLLREGKLPGLASLLGGSTAGELPHAWLDRSMVSVLPAVTAAAWATVFTGEPPARNGITGNEFFIRERRRLAAPIPSSFDDPEPIVATYTDDYANRLLETDTVYERLRRAEPGIRIWVSVGQFYRGADRLVVAQRSAAIDMLPALIRDTFNGERRAIYEERDQEIIDTVCDALADEDEPVPDVLTVYVSGGDQYAHVAPEGPERALRDYLTGTLDDAFADLRRALDARGALADRWVVVVTDHGQAEVREDDRHHLGVEGEHEPPEVLRRAGFRVRPFRHEVDEDDDFQAVLAYQGPMAFVYLADRSSCASEGALCDWTRPPRLEEDVLAAAEAFHRASREGRPVAALEGTLALVLARRPRPWRADDEAFQVYLGGGRLESLESHLERRPHPSWIRVASRLRDLAVGPHGERAGDLILVAAEDDGGLHYFNDSPYRSIHGGPARDEGEVALVVAHPRERAATIGRRVRAALGPRPGQDRVAELLLALRAAHPVGPERRAASER